MKYIYVILLIASVGFGATNNQKQQSLSYYSQQSLTSNQSITNTSLTSFPTQTTLSFTPSVNGKYRIAATGSFYTNSTGLGQNAIVALRATTGSPTFIAYGDAYFVLATASYAQSVHIYIDVTLTGGTPYAFSIQGQIGAGTLTMDSNHTANGTYITATQIN